MLKNSRHRLQKACAESAQEEIPGQSAQVTIDDLHAADQPFGPQPKDATPMERVMNGVAVDWNGLRALPPPSDKLPAAFIGPLIEKTPALGAGDLGKLEVKGIHKLEIHDVLHYSEVVVRDGGRLTVEPYAPATPLGGMIRLR